MNEISPVLIANRGEIAVRVITACKSMRLKAVAVYSDADANSLHVEYSDQAVRIGPPRASDSYLNIDTILDAARTSGAKSVHPGYGFLAENADFAQAVVDAGLVFIGPPPEVIRLMGDKVAAKQLMVENGVPVVPGYSGDDQSDDTLAHQATSIGYPLMVKAAAGGGGRGMRTVGSPDTLQEAIAAARRESLGAFGDDRLFIEKLIVKPRHIEVQVLGDSHGNLIHLYERDCTIQRRHQKVIEEAPSPVLDSEQRTAICEAAVKAARAANYVNAGTVEFLWSDGDFYFLEMNTRIQVEHGVTEMVTLRNLVEAQLYIAAGNPVSWTQGEISIGKRHAIECRICAEDPRQDFLPQTGKLSAVEFGNSREPHTHTRIDEGIRAGDEITPYYDSLLAKIIVAASGPRDDDGDTRTARKLALNGMEQALNYSHIDGVTTNTRFLAHVVRDMSVTNDHAISTSWLEDNREVALNSDHSLEIAVTTMFDLSPDSSLRSDGSEIWFRPSGWRIGIEKYRLAYVAGEYRYEVLATRAGPHWTLKLTGESATWVMEGVHANFGRPRVDWRNPPERIRGELWRKGSDATSILSTGGIEKFQFVLVPTGEREQRAMSIYFDTHVEGTLNPVDPIRRGPLFVSGAIARTSVSGAVHSETVMSPMPGTLIKVNVSAGDHVEARQPLAILEAMKMEHALEAPRAGTVKAVHFEEGAMVTSGQTIIELEDE